MNSIAEGKPTGSLLASASSEFSDTKRTLDEPVRETIMRDLRAIWGKLRFVLLPTYTSEGIRELQDWDMWGPFFMCLTLSVVLSFQPQENDQSGFLFALVYVLIWLGSAVISVNTTLLIRASESTLPINASVNAPSIGKHLSLFQSVCILGYCTCPLVVSAILCLLIRSFNLKLLKLAIILLGISWGSVASLGYMSRFLPEDKKALGAYPVVLFYFVLGWVILVA